MPAVEVLNSTRKFATVASTLPTISRAIKIVITEKTRWLELIK
jgi:hypothetical protein